MNKPASCILLCGGNSSRMGRDKATLPLASGESILSDMLRRLKRRFQTVYLATGREVRYADTGCPAVLDVFSSAGALGGVHAGLCASATEINFVVACDMPGFSDEMMAIFLATCGAWDVMIPEDGTGLHPLFGVYKKSCLRAIEKCLRQGSFKMTDFHPDVKVKRVPAALLFGDISGSALANLNTPEEFQHFLDRSDGEQSAP